MLTQVELNLREETDKIALNIRVTKVSINIKKGYADFLRIDGTEEEWSKKDYEVKLLEMKLKGLEAYMDTLQDIEHLIGSDD